MMAIKHGINNWCHLVYLYLSVLFRLDENEISGAAAAPTAHSSRPLHGNNYELSEFDARGPTYRYERPHAIT